MCNPGFISSGSQFTVSDISYDPQGNIETLTRNAPTTANPEGTPVDQLSYNYTARTNRLVSVADAVTTPLDWDAKPSTFQYNRVGSMTRTTETLGVGYVRQTDVQVYNEHQLPENVRIRHIENLQVSDRYAYYRYDANGLRISKRIRESAHGSDLVYERYVRDGDRLVGVFDENNELKSWNLGGAAGLVGRADPNPWSLNPVHRYYVTDHLGSIRAVLNASGTVVEGRDYYPYGLTMPGRFYVQADTTKEGFTGHELDKETGDYYAGARYYSPALARWLVVDPLADEYPGWSPFNYTMGNPVMLIDPDGMAACDPPIDCVDFAVGVGQGAWQGLKNTVSGFWNAVTNPRQTAEGIVSAVTNPDDTWNAISTAVSERVDQFRTGNATERGQVIGEATVFVVEAVAGTKGAAMLTRSTRAVTVTNPVPTSVSRVIPGDATNVTTLGRPGVTDVFVTATNDIRGLDAAGLSQRLTIPSSNSFTVIDLPTPTTGLASPINRMNPGFVGGGRTSGGAREFVIPNRPIPPNATIRTIK